MYEPILDALRRGAAAEALSAAEQAVAADPQDAGAHRLHAAALRLSGEREGAVAALDRALGLTPEDAQLHLERAGALLDGRQLDEAQAALATAIGLDPNQFPAYIVKAHLAIARGDLDEAERLGRTASRIAPGHPQVAAVEGSLALRRGDTDRALAVLSHAASLAPDDAQIVHALAFAYLAKGHLAFAEQAFLTLAERHPDQPTLQLMIADLMRRQQRFGEAADRVAAVAERDDAGFGVQRWLGELELDAGRPERALPALRSALAVVPDDPRTLNAIMEAWRRLDDIDDARRTLESALATHADLPNLWRARLALEPFAEAGAVEVIERWQQAMPGHLGALEARAAVHDQVGEHAEAEAIAHRIVELHPGDVRAEMRIVQGLAETDPDAAAERIERLISLAPDPLVKRELRQLLGRAFDLAGQPEAAAATWAELHAEVIDQRLPRNTISRRNAAEWPAMAPVADGAQGVLLLWGAPGSRVERFAQMLTAVGAPLLVDRYGEQPPTDPLQRYGTVEELLAGTLDPAFLVKMYRAALPARGAAEGPVFDWLLWWDNALLRALRPYLPQAMMLIAVRDPRDMLLDWLAFGSTTPYALETPEAGARWLAQTLDQVADLHEHDLFPHNLVKIDEILDDPGALAQAIADTLRIQVSLPNDLSLGGARLAPGRWRQYTGPLGDAFALLKPVARRLGYPEN